ncbi:MAG: hypothetical protein KF788_17780 [Piscinibacter sp.]|nr:hypothetical protein [Piscinibacter sp.]
MALIETLGLRPTERMLRARQGAAAPSSSPHPGPRAPHSAAGAAPPSSAAVKVGADVEVISREFPAVRFKYGELKLAGTLKFQAMGVAGAGGGGFTGAVTSKDKPGGRVTGSKKTFAYGDIADRELFAGFTLADISVGFEPQISGLDISLSGLVKFTVVTRAFRAPAQAKLLLLNLKGGKEIAGPALEFKVAPVQFVHRTGSTELRVFAEYQATLTVNAKKIGAEIGKELLEKAAKELLEKEAKRQGTKRLARKAGEFILKDLGPLAAAFGVGLDIGGLLNQYTAAPQAAKFVIDEILGDLAQRYHKKDTLGKMWLISKNSPRILAALIAGGVIGTMAGVGDLVLFKLFGLDKLGDYAVSLKAFGQGLTELAAVAKIPSEVLGDALLHGAFALGIKYNPKYAVLYHPTLEPIVAAIFARIKPLYRTSGGLDKLMSVLVRDAGIAPLVLLKFAAHVHAAGKTRGGRVDPTDPASVAVSLRAMHVGAFMRFLEANQLIGCTMSFSDSLDPDDIDQELLDELFG